MISRLSPLALSLVFVAGVLPAQYAVGPAGSAFSPIGGVPGAVLLATISACDDCVETLTLPFPFPVAGNPITSVVVTSNGAVMLDPTTQNLCCSPWSLDHGTAGGAFVLGVPVSRISVIQEDLDPAGGAGFIYTLNTGISVIISWEAVSFFPGPASGSANAQLELFSNGLFEIRYGANVPLTNDVVCGITLVSGGVTQGWTSAQAAMPEFNAFGQTSGAILPQNSGALFVPLAPQYQTNSPAFDLTVNGAAGTSFNPASVAIGVNSVSNLALSSTLSGPTHDVLISGNPLVPAGLVTANGQVINVDYNDPTAIFLYGTPLSSPLSFSFPFTGNYSLPFSFATPIFATAQGAIINPGSPDGVTLSAPVEYQAVGCAVSQNFDGLTANNGGTASFGPYPIGWTGSGATQWQVRTGVTTSTPTGPLVGAFSLPNYMYCETSVAANSVYIMDTCGYDATQLSTFTLNFRLSRIGATIGTLNVRMDDGTGTFPTIMATYTGPEPTGADWTAETINILPFLPGTAIARIRFEYTSGSSFTGDLAIDDFDLQ